MIFYARNENVTISKILKVSKIVTVELQEIIQSPFTVIKFITKRGTIMHPFFKDFKDLSPMLGKKSFGKATSDKKNSRSFSS